MTVRVICDTASDLPEEVADKLAVKLVPLHIRFGGKEFADREEMGTKEFWEECARSEQLPETSAPAPGAFAAVFEEIASSGADGVVCVTLSSKLSATHEVAKQAAQELPGFPVKVVDSLSVTLGEGLVCIAAAEVAARGGALDQVVAAAESAKSRLSVFGAIDTLENLRRGGRIGGAAAALGTLLSIKPVIEVRGGTVEQESRQRTRARSLRYLVEKLKAAGPVERFGVMAANAPDLPEFLEMLGDVVSDHERLVGDIGPVVATHTGSGVIGLAWVARAGPVVPGP